MVTFSAGAAQKCVCGSWGQARASNLKIAITQFGVTPFKKKKNKVRMMVSQFTELKGRQ